MKTTRRNFAKVMGAALVVAPAVQAAIDPSDPLHDFEKYLSKDELDRIHKDVAESAPFLQKFREVRLKNGDEPDFTFNALAKR
ncbi:MAG TPA: hypothetical protein VJ901_01820 [Thermoanaerobaculia bacterium]|nr:hypothetical protein [Thermoanaerobaculia bacterium]